MPDETKTQPDEYGLAADEVRNEPAAGRSRLRGFVAAVTLFPFVLLAGTLTWMSSASYLRQMKVSYLHTMGYGERLHGADCEVLIDGDSTALVGLSPAIIEKRTGLRTCNIAEVASVKQIVGMTILDTYLTHNQRPRILVFLFGAANLSAPDSWLSGTSFEGVLYSLQTHRYGLLFKHPLYTLQNAELGLRTGVLALSPHARTDDPSRERDRRRGQVPLEGGALLACPYNPPVQAPNPAWVRHLRDTYGVSGTRVVIDVMPEVDCDTDRAFYRGRITGLVDNGAQTLPKADFSSSGRWHVNDAGAEVLSGQVATQILALRADAQPDPAAGGR